jgi:hypothetical protein
MALRNDQIPGNCEAATASDTAFVDYFGIYVGTGGDVAVKTNQGATAVTFKNVPTGTIIPLRIVQVMSTNTTASDIVGFKV